MLGVVDDLAQAVEISEEKVSALVCGETAAEANHQGVGVDALQERHHTRRVALVAEPLLRELVADILDELLLEGHASLPNLVVGHVVDGVPNAFVALVAHEGRIEILIVDLTPLCCAPCGEVDAIGDVAHVILLREVAFPYRREHLLADPAVEL